MRFPWPLLLGPLLMAASALAGELDEQVLAAARAGNVAELKALLDKGGDVNAKSPYGATPIFFAAGNGHFEAVKLLGERGANVNVQDTFYKMTPIRYAASKKHAGIVRYLFTKGATSADNMLGMALDWKDPESVKAALAGKPSLDTLSTALSLAERTGQAEAIALLKEAGAQPLQAAAVDARVLESYAGRYRAEIGDFLITVKDAKLLAQFGSRPALALIARDNVTFLSDVVGTRWTFVVKDGKPSSIQFRQDGRDFTFERIAQ